MNLHSQGSHGCYEHILSKTTQRLREGEGFEVIKLLNCAAALQYALLEFIALFLPVYSELLSIPITQLGHWSFSLKESKIQ